MMKHFLGELEVPHLYSDLSKLADLYDFGSQSYDMLFCFNRLLHFLHYFGFLDLFFLCQLLDKRLTQVHI